MRFFPKIELKNPSALEKIALVRQWSFVMAAAIWIMAIVGGVTRLTGSGLSITTWDPIMGILPPFTEADWEALFALYQQSPEFLYKNSGATLSFFKSIFWLEYIHRLWGRFLGIIFLAPWIYFILRSWITRRQALLYLGLFMGGGLQGALGWYMVSSGLVDVPWVSPYRLAAHLLLATLLMAGFAVMGTYTPHHNKGHPQPSRLPQAQRFAVGLIGSVGIVLIATLLWGAYVAGLKAGLIYPTFPTMNGYWIPPELTQGGFSLESATQTPGIVQFIHRVLAVLSLILAWTLAVILHRRSLLLLAVMVTAQAGLGIITLLYGVPLVAAAAHQAWGMLVITAWAVIFYQALQPDTPPHPKLETKRRH